MPNGLNDPDHGDEETQEMPRNLTGADGPGSPTDDDEELDFPTDDDLSDEEAARIKANLRLRESQAYPPDLSNVPNSHGAKILAISGVEKDDAPSEIPAGSVVLDIAIPSRNPGAIMNKISGIIDRYHGFHAVAFSTSGYLRCQVLFPNFQQAQKAAVNIYRSGISKNSRFAVVEDRGSVESHRGRILFKGNAFSSSLYLHLQEELGSLPFLKNQSLQMASLTEELDPEKENTPFSQEKLSHNSVQHALSTKEIRPLATEKCVLLHVRLVDTHLENERVNVLIHHLMDAFESETGTIIKWEGGTDLKIFVGHGRSVGNVLQKIAPFRTDMEDLGIPAVLNFGSVFYSETRADHLVRSPMVDRRECEPGVGGLLCTEAFEKEADQSRNSSLAHFRTGMQYGVLKRLTSISPLYFEAEKGAPHVTIGRTDEINRINGNSDKAFKEGKTQVTVILGEGGSGKTEMANVACNYRLKEKPEDFGEMVPTVYYFPLKEDRNESGKYISALIRGIFLRVPALQSDFKDLYYYARGVPRGADPSIVIASSQFKNSRPALMSRFSSFINAATDLGPLQVIADDLQWADDFSTDVLAYVLKCLPENKKLHFFLLARTDSGRMPSSISTALGKCKAKVNKMELERIRVEGNPEILEPYIRSRLPEAWRTAIIPESFPKELAEVAGGERGALPVIFSNIMTALLNKGVLKVRGGKLVVPKDANAISRFKGDNEMATVMNVMQERFSELSKKALEAADYLVTLGDVDRNLFEEVLKILGYEEEQIEAMLDELYQNNIIGFNPFGFTHDYLRVYRESQLQGDRGELSLNALKIYNALIGEQPSSTEICRISQISQIQPLRAGVHPTTLLNLLIKTLERVDLFGEEVTRGLSDHYVTQTYNTAAYCLQRNENPRVLEIIGTFREKLGKTMERSLTQPGTIQELKLTWGQKLINIYLIGVDAAIRVGKTEKAEEYARLIKEISRAISAGASDQPEESDQEIFLDPRDPRALSLAILVSRIAWAINDKAKMREAEKELELALYHYPVEGIEKDRGFLEYGVVSMRQMTNPEMLRERERSLKMRFEPKLERAKALGHIDEAHEYEAMIWETKRISLMRRWTAFFHAHKGVDHEVALMQDYSPFTREIAEFERGFIEIIEVYRDDQSLVMYPQQEGYLYVELARLRFMMGQGEEGHSIVQKGREVGEKKGMFTLVARTRKLEGDYNWGRAIRENLLDPSSWDPTFLQTAIDHYEQGMSELFRDNEKDPYLDLLALNLGIAVAMQTLWYTRPGNHIDFNRERYRDKLEMIYPSVLNALASLKRYDTKIGNLEWDYLKELATLGMIREALKKLGSKALMPLSSGDFEVSRENIINAIQKNREKGARDNLSQKDNELITFRETWFLELLRNFKPEEQ